MQPIHCLTIKMILKFYGQTKLAICVIQWHWHFLVIFPKYSGSFNSDVTVIIRSEGNTSHKLSNNLLLLLLFDCENSFFLDFPYYGYLFITFFHVFLWSTSSFTTTNLICLIITRPGTIFHFFYMTQP